MEGRGQERKEESEVAGEKGKGEGPERKGREGGIQCHIATSHVSTQKQK